jgi:hypothetical protein
MNRGPQQQPVHICFFSTKCEWSKAFISEIAQTPYKAEFRFINVDPSPQRPPLPGWLKKVPTLVIAGEPEPRTDADVMNWLYERKLKDGRSGQALVSGGGGAQAQGPAEPAAFAFGEMGGIYDDAYSSVDDTELQPMGHNFSYLGGAAAQGTREGQQFQVGGGGMGGGGGDHRSKKEKMFDAQMEAYQKDRNAGIPQLVRRQ